MDKPTDRLHCLVTKYGWGPCPKCWAGFPQYCRGRGGVPKTKKKDSRNG
jgi:hypothetical protein